ncbi:hypothetical protein QTP88_023465 [Uroleucon formosanum]
MKRTQQSLLHFYKKSKQSTESVDDTVPSTSNVLQDDDIMATFETEKTAPSPSVVSPVIEPSLKCLDSKFDIGGYVEYKKNLSDKEKVSILQNAGKGSHEKLGKLVLKPLTKLKDALEDFRNHEKNYYHKNSLLTADNIKAILEKKQDNILIQLNSKRKDEVIKNRAKLKPIIQIIRLCGRQQIALRGHEDSGRISLEEPKNNDDIRNAFGIISECCSFFNSSAKRTTVLQNKIKEIKPNSQSTKLKSLCETRWVLRHEAVMLFKEFIEPVVAALEVQNECSGTDSSKRANSLLHCIFEKPFSYLKKGVEFYENDLPGLNDVIEAEYEIRQAKWKNIEDNLKPTTAIEALSVCDNLMYPNMYELLKILAIIPISTATAERSFSTLRRLKTYLRNTTSESRLVGLALLTIHRDIDLSDDILLDKFANSGKERNLNLI